MQLHYCWKCLFHMELFHLHCFWIKVVSFCMSVTDIPVHFARKAFCNWETYDLMCCCITKPMSPARHVLLRWSCMQQFLMLCGMLLNSWMIVEHHRKTMYHWTFKFRCVFKMLLKFNLVDFKKREKWKYDLFYLCIVEPT